MDILHIPDRKVPVCGAIPGGLSSSEKRRECTILSGKESSSGFTLPCAGVLSVSGFSALLALFPGRIWFILGEIYLPYTLRI